MRKHRALVMALVCVLGLVGCGQQQNISEENKDEPIYVEQQEPSNIAIEASAYTYEELSKMPAEELLDLFIQNGLVINDDLKASYTEEELQTLFKEHFDMWHIGLSALSHTMYLDLAEQTKEVYDKIVVATQG